MVYFTCCCHLSGPSVEPSPAVPEKPKYGRDNATHARKNILMLMCDWFIAVFRYSVILSFSNCPSLAKVRFFRLISLLLTKMI